MLTGKQDSEKLMNAALPLAEEMLKDYGEFYPYGAYMKHDGEIVHVGAKDEDTDHPKSRELIYLLREHFKEMAAKGECKAIAIVADVLVHVPSKDKKADAIQVCMEHWDGYSIEVFVPYDRTDNGEVVYSPMFAHEREREIFPSASR